MTHVISKNKKPTNKTLCGILSGTWVVSEDWIKKCESENRFVEEDSFGSRFHSEPFKGTLFYISPSFRDKKKKSQISKIFEKFGKAKLVEEWDENVEYVLVNSIRSISQKDDYKSQAYFPSKIIDWRNIDAFNIPYFDLSSLRN